MHGGDIYSREIEYDFSVNLNPLGIPSFVKKGIEEAVLLADKYPDINCSELKTVLADYCKVSSDRIVCGNGASELIFALCQMLRPKSALIIRPSFSGYERALSSVGADIKYINLTKESGFTKTEMSLPEAIRAVKPEMVILSNPNNPNGYDTFVNERHDIVKACNETGTHLIIDECFIELTAYNAVETDDEDKKPTFPGRSFADCLNDSKGMIIIRAMTKSFAIPGIRIGYGLCSDKMLCAYLGNYLPEWNVSIFAQKAGVSAFEDKAAAMAYLDKARKTIRSERDFLSRELQNCGLKVFPSRSNFILFWDPKKDIRKLSDIFLEKKILIRDCSDYEGLGEGYYRIAVKKHEENLKLTEILKEI